MTNKQWNALLLWMGLILVAIGIFLKRFHIYGWRQVETAGCVSFIIPCVLGLVQVFRLSRDGKWFNIHLLQLGGMLIFFIGVIMGIYRIPGAIVPVVAGGAMFFASYIILIMTNRVKKQDG